jgi:hypothetical protein
MPHLEQLPGVSLSTPLHIGQKYFFPGWRDSAVAILLA